MPNTMLRSGLLDSDRFNQLGWPEQGFYVRLLLASDDAGRFDGRPEVLKSALYPIMPTVRVSDLKLWLDACVAVGLVLLYQYGEKPYVQITRWQRRSPVERSRYPWEDGSYILEFTAVETPTKSRLFVTTSLQGLGSLPKPCEGLRSSSGETSSPSPSPSSEDSGDPELLSACIPRQARPRFLVRVWNDMAKKTKAGSLYWQAHSPRPTSDLREAVDAACADDEDYRQAIEAIKVLAARSHEDGVQWARGRPWRTSEGRSRHGHMGLKWMLKRLTEILDGSVFESRDAGSAGTDEADRLDRISD